MRMMIEQADRPPRLKGGQERSGLAHEQVEAMLWLWGEYQAVRVDADQRGYRSGGLGQLPGWGRRHMGGTCAAAQAVERALARLDGRLALILRQKYQWGLSDEAARRDERLWIDGRPMGRERYARERVRAVERLRVVLAEGCVAPLRK